MRIESEVKLNFNNVLIKPKRNTLVSRSQVNLSRTFKTKHSRVEMNGIPIIASNMDTVGTMEMATSLSAQNIYTVLHKFYTVEEWVKFTNNIENLDHCFVSSGISDQDLDKLDTIIKVTGIKNICIDVANGYSERFLEIIRNVRHKYPSCVLMAGNVCTPEMTESLIIAGADIVKLGIGPGFGCATRNKTGVGYPQLSCVIECSDAAHGLGGLVVSDGGCKEPSDLSKAFGGGADFVMIGSMFAGHYESGGNKIEKDGKLYKEFYGMSSDKAMQKYYNGVPSYRASEGKDLLIEYRGPIENTLKEVLGGLRSTCTYVGADSLKNLCKCTTFIMLH
jgi:GMP reductase